MSDKDLSRYKVINDVCERRLRRKDAAQILNLSERQVQRLMNRLRESGAASLVHGARGKPSNNRISSDYRQTILALVRKHYSDFSPTLAREKLIEIHNLPISNEALRQWMIADSLWVPHSQRQPRVYQPRYRRDCLGELIQIDGSHHDWFEGRSQKCCLLVFIDDATGRLMNLRFSETESAIDYMVTTREYLETHGKPLAFYSDRHAVFHNSNKNAVEAKNPTQYGRILKELGIELICANSSQAKGRVERANLTLQDRLIKEMRLQGINTIKEANIWLPYFITDFNQRFAKLANYPKDMHRPIRETSADLDDIFAWQVIRKLSKSLTFQYDQVVYLIENTEENARLVYEHVLILEYPNGDISVRYGHKALKYKIFDKLAKLDQGRVVENKRLGQVLRFAQDKQDEFEVKQKRKRNNKTASRTAQRQAMNEQLRALNPVLVEPEQFIASHTKITND
ncbi:ISNCY family transposase [Vibrio vulnificus]|nr:ISNCY family transposase [Vibrio vulnificus]